MSADSLDGVARSRVPARSRFASRNFRAIYRKLFEAYGIAGGIGRPFPIVPIAIPDGSAFPLSSGAQLSIFRID